MFYLAEAQDELQHAVLVNKVSWDLSKKHLKVKPRVGIGA